jgi:hypothetical protein
LTLNWGEGGRIKRCCGRPAGSIRVDTSTRCEASAFKQNTRYTMRGRGVGACAGAGASAGVLAEAVRRHQVEVAAPK